MSAVYRDAVRIRMAERDSELALDALEWPSVIPPGWDAGPGWLRREIPFDPDDLPGGPITETMLRFPSAPLHGVQRVHEYHVNVDPSENFHTYRVLSDPDYDEPIERIFLLHNGLNELEKMSLYYQLASHLISENPATMCILRPFPGHLTRFAFQAFAETPLDRYLWDGSHLFRQFLRFMVETQWLLSAIVRRSMYRVPAGAVLLGASEHPADSRLETEVLKGAMASEWHALYDASRAALDRLHAQQGDAPQLNDPPEDEQPFRDAITTLRKALRLDRHPWLGPDLEGDPRDAPEPTLHVVGYSLGGFAAQSVFMSWPYVIASCVTLLSGGPLRELAPTAFADPEEWQTVLHSLRYELDEGMTTGRFTAGAAVGDAPPSAGNGERERIAGLEHDLFLYFKRTFYEVFQQEYHGSFQTRLEAFRPRMLFVVGGNDPIVRPRSVLDSGPPGGINLLEIGGLSHFLGSRPADDQESRQREFWVPEIARLIDRFADDAADKHALGRADTWLDADLCLPDLAVGENQDDPHAVRRLTVPERLAVERDGALPGKLFQQCIDDLLIRQESKDGLLFILRNEVPTLLLDRRAIQEHATLLNHDDEGIADYTHGVRRRFDLLERYRPGTAVILPWNARRIMLRMDAHPGYPSQAESAKGQMPTKVDPETTWRECERICTKLAQDEGIDSVRIFDGRRPLDEQSHAEPQIGLLLEAAERFAGNETVRIVPSLPDCWVWMSRRLLNIGGGDPLTIAEGRSKLCTAVPTLCERRSTMLGDLMRTEDLRIVTVSRARYNPRFRGRLVADMDSAKRLLLHIALCVTASVPFTAFDLEAGAMREAPVAG